MSQTQAPPAPPTAAAPGLSAATDPTANWGPAPTTQPSPRPTAEKPAAPRVRKTGGMPMAPVVTAAANGTVLAVASAYQAGGLPALVGTAGGIGVTAVAAAARRRSTVKRRTTAAASRAGRRTANGMGSTPTRTAGGRPASAASSSSRRVPAGSTGGTSGARVGGLLRKPGNGSKHTTTPSPSGRSGTAPGSTPGAGKHRPGTTGQPRPHRAGRQDTTGHRPGARPTAKTHTSGTPGRLRRIAARLGNNPKTTNPGTKPAAGAAQPAQASRTRVAATKARRVTARAMRATRGAAWDSFLAGLAGGISGLWHWDKQAAANRAREVWRKRRAKRATKAEAQAKAAEAAASTPDTETPAPIAKTVRRPAHAHRSATTTGAPAMPGGHHFLASAMEMARAAAAYSPSGMVQVGEDFAALPDSLEQVAQAMRTTVQQCEGEYPLDPSIVDLVGQIYRLQIQAAELARELAPAFEKLHHVDLERIRNPRKGSAEAMWDYSRNA